MTRSVQDEEQLQLMHFRNEERVRSLAIQLSDPEAQALYFSLSSRMRKKEKRNRPKGMLIDRLIRREPRIDRT